MSAQLTGVLVGRERPSHGTVCWALLAFVAFASSFLGYAIGVFSVPGGVVWIPGDAAVVGVSAAVLGGYARGGVLVGWLVTYASLLGYAARRSLFGYANATVGETLGYFFDPEALLVLALEGLVLGVVAVAVGSLCRFGVDGYRRRSSAG